MDSMIESAMDKATKPAIDKNDILGASLRGRDPNSLKILELKRWLICRNSSMKGRKPNLFYDKYRVTQR